MKRTFYHVTPKGNLPSIMESGLLPSKSESSLKAVFLSSDPSVAQGYSSMKDGECCLLAVEVDSGLVELGPDNYELRDALEAMSEDELEEVGLWSGAEWSDCSWEKSLSMCGQVACYTKISPDCIRTLSENDLSAKRRRVP